MMLLGLADYQTVTAHHWFMQLPPPVNVKVEHRTQTTDKLQQGVYTHSLYPHTNQKINAPFL